MITFQIDHLEKEKREHLVKLKQQEKKWDYLVRALHIEEVELRQAEYEKWAVDDKESWEKFERERIEKAHHEHELLVGVVFCGYIYIIGTILSYQLVWCRIAKLVPVELENET